LGFAARGAIVDCAQMALLFFFISQNLLKSDKIWNCDSYVSTLTLGVADLLDQQRQH